MSTDIRTRSERDIDRLLYTYYFRRLAEITQVSSHTVGRLRNPASGKDALLHNRLTHSLKVGQVALRMSQMLKSKPDNEPGIALAGGLDPVVAEAAGRAHDLGHPPYGHIGEQVLDKVAREMGLSDGFEGNAQTFRILCSLVMRISNESISVTGLDLSPGALASCVKYPWKRGDSGKTFNKFGFIELDKTIFDQKVAPLLYIEGLGTLEAQIMDWADDITYASHDIEDFSVEGSIPLSLLAHHNHGTTLEPDYRPIALDEFEVFWDYATTRLGDSPEIANAEAKKEFQKFAASFPRRRADGSRQTASHLGALSSRIITEAINATWVDERGVLCVKPETRALVNLLKQLTWCYVIDSPDLVVSQRGQRRKLDAVTRELISWALEAFAQKEVTPWGEEKTLSSNERRANRRRLPPLLRELVEALLAENGRRGAYLDDESKNIIRATLDYVASLCEEDIEMFYKEMIG